MSIEILDCLKRKRDICIKNITPSQNTAFMWIPALSWSMAAILHDFMVDAVVEVVVVILHTRLRAIPLATMAIRALAGASLKKKTVVIRYEFSLNHHSFMYLLIHQFVNLLIYRFITK